VPRVDSIKKIFKVYGVPPGEGFAKGRNEGFLVAGLWLVKPLGVLDYCGSVVVEMPFDSLEFLTKEPSRVRSMLERVAEFELSVITDRLRKIVDALDRWAEEGFSMEIPSLGASLSRSEEFVLGTWHWLFKDRDERLAFGTRIVRIRTSVHQCVDVSVPSGWEHEWWWQWVSKG